ncbi:SIR2 family protein [Vogesella indigofera]|uniref:SIR2 family protein n=1 Tax=Vogesella indigofera TaxID=45465 RepID=UPI003F431A03
MINWPKELVSAIARRKAVIFIGAGVSMNCTSNSGRKPPSWKEFLEEGIEKIAHTKDKTELRALLKSGDYLNCCQILKEKLNTDWVPYLEDCFVTPGYSPNELQKSIFKLDSSIVMTPNVDKIYDQYVNSANDLQINNVKIKKYFDNDIPRVLRGNGKQRLLLKIHGCIDTPDNLIFTRQDYADIRNKHSNFYKAIDALILTHAFIFIGCGMNDPDLQLILENYARTFGAAPPHYITLSEKISNNYESILAKNFNLKVLKYSPANNHIELLDSIQKLATDVEQERALLSQSTLW